MKSRESKTVLLAFTFVATVWQAGASTSNVGDQLEGYRSWKALTSEAQLVPFELALQCAPVTEKQLEMARTRHGPHTWRWIKVSKLQVWQWQDTLPPFTFPRSRMKEIKASPIQIRN